MSGADFSSTSTTSTKKKTTNIILEQTELYNSNKKEVKMIISLQEKVRKLERYLTSKNSQIEQLKKRRDIIKV